MSPAKAFTRKTPHSSAGHSAASTSQQTPAVRILLVDHEESLLKGFGDAVEQINLTAGVQRIDGRTYLMQSHNGLLAKLEAWRQSDWVPDLILIDKNIDSAGGTSRDYVRELQGAETNGNYAFVTIPVVIHTKANPNETDANNFVMARADGYLWSRTSSEEYFQACINSLPLWRAQAHRRVWQTLLDITSTGLARAATVEKAIAFLEQTSFPFMQQFLGCDHGFVRRRSIGQRFPLVTSFLNDWARIDKTDHLNDLPLINEVLEKGFAQRASISNAEAGRYPTLVGKAMVGAVLKEFGDQAPIGAVTLVRDLVRNKPFNTDDLSYLRRFAEQLGSVYGRQSYLERRQAEMKAARDFATFAARATSEDAVCQQLVQVAHGLLNDDVDDQAKVTVRLVPLGQASLHRRACAGYCNIEAEPILLTEKTIYTAAVLKAETQFFDTIEDLRQQNYLQVGSLKAGTELCVPLRVMGPDQQVVALGAVNAEHVDQHAYGHSNRSALEVLAQMAAAALLRLRQQSALDALAELATTSLHSPTSELWEALNAAMSAYAGHGVLLHLVPPAKPDVNNATPWRVEHVWQPKDERNQSTDLLPWQIHFDRSWASTFTASAIEQFQAGNQLGTLYSTHFATTEGLLGGADGAVRANAAAPLWINGHLVGVWLFIWYGLPALDAGGLQVLERFANYAEGLLRFQKNWNTAEKRLQRAEQLAELADYAQMYEHMLQNHLGSMSTSLEYLRRATLLDEAQQLGAELEASLKGFANRAHMTAKAMKNVEISTIHLSEVWEQACQELQLRASKLGVVLVVPDDSADWQVHSDPDVLRLVLFILVQNALDALESAGTSSGRVWLEADNAYALDGMRCFRVRDNGPGIASHVLGMLCQQPATTKTRGQGIALNTQANRVRKDLQGILQPSQPQPERGASFDLVLPVREAA